jgi:hypothetical protein
MRRPTIGIPVRSFIAEAFNQPAEVAGFACVSIGETAAVKFVALPRRAGAEQAEAGGLRDSTLVRHIYDLHVIREHYDAAEVVSLAREIMLADA